MAHVMSYRSAPAVFGLDNAGELTCASVQNPTVRIMAL